MKKVKFGIRPTLLWTAFLSAAILSTPGTTSASVTFPALTAKQARSVDNPFAGGSYADTSFEDVPYVSAEFLADLFGQTTLWDPQAQQLRVQGAGKREWVFTLDNPFVSLQGQVYNLTYPVRRGPERVYLPLHTLLRMLNSRFDVDLRQGSAATPAGTKPAAASATSVAASAVPPSPDVAALPADLVAGLALEESGGGSVLSIRSGAGVRWQGIRTGSHYLLRAFDARLAADVPRKLRAGAGASLTGVEAIQEGKVVQLTLRLKNPDDSVELMPQVAQAGTEPGWRITVRSPEKAPAGKGVNGTIILDAGHGGHDRGATIKGVQEAAVTLAVVLQLEQELKDMGYKVRLTRDEDVFKTLPERPKFASDNNGDVFVSMHCNSLAGSPQRLANVTGYVAYILREGESEEDKAIARRENQAIEQSGKKKAAEISPLDWIVLEHQLNLYSKQSEALAESIIRNFSGFEIPRYSTGARQAGFFVLVGAYMPAVLFEMGFLTHERDRRVLASPEGQREIAKRMAKAIDAFQRSRS
jgi:N-acetylmuramoyl-L-alanine amidase